MDSLLNPTSQCPGHNLWPAMHPLPFGSQQFPGSHPPPFNSPSVCQSFRDDQPSCFDLHYRGSIEHRIDVFLKTYSFSFELLPEVLLCIDHTLASRHLSDIALHENLQAEAGCESLGKNDCKKSKAGTPSGEESASTETYLIRCFESGCPLKNPFNDHSDNLYNLVLDGYFRASAPGCTIATRAWRNPTKLQRVILPHLGSQICR